MQIANMLIIALTSIVIAACEKREPTSSTAAPETREIPPSAYDPGPEIAWFEGGVDAAFERAKLERKPVILYWGAEWCPPCHELKAVVFSRRDFIEKSKLFIPVYLDGDQEGAQKWGETFRISGYPTFVVLTADRKELARISGGRDLSQYAEVLDLVLGDVRPMSDVLASLDGSTKLSRDDCRRLSYHGWVVDNVNMDAPGRTATALQRAVQSCPDDARIEKARLTVVAALAFASADSELLKAGKPPSARTAALVTNVNELLADQELALSAADPLRWLSEDFFSAAKRAHPKLVPELQRRWTHVMDAAASDGRFSETDQIGAIASKLLAIKTLNADGKIPEPIQRTATERVAAALAKKHTQHARPGIVNSSLWVYHYLDRDDLAYALLEHEVKTAKEPYYYMLDLAALEEENGHKDKAIEWLERAYRESQGAATRFQWGTEYVLGLLRMRPEDSKAIRVATEQVLSELEGTDRIYMRTAGRLKRLDKELREWNEAGKHAEVLAAVKKRMDDICDKIPEGETARQSCDAFLKT